FTNGLQFQTSYTFSRSFDTGQTSTTFTTNNVPFNVFDLSHERARSNFDTPHKFVASAVWTPDFFGSQGDSKVGRAIFHGFTIAPVFYAFSGSPYSGTLSVTGAGGAGQINQSGGSNRIPILERNSFRRPKIVNFDMRVSRRFNLGETRNLEFLVEGFNLFNRTQVTNVTSTMYSANFTTGVLTFNQPFQAVTEAGATLFRERQVQMAVRFEF
ncbi:MAG: hypothetical protein LC746_17740, partial [Acidobacteria bacterium]|nr:hypothetical protein [Acidobacteriota bacterium]